MAREMVEIETPALRATSPMLAAFLSFPDIPHPYGTADLGTRLPKKKELCKLLQILLSNRDHVGKQEARLGNFLYMTAY
jgi:hypothetical protein